MNNKFLSICIPSYNMERYLNRCVDSLLAVEVLDDIEIIIVNDGSKDATLSIANQYKAQYPNSVVVIDKPNGHYGSTVNAALKVAAGKYFRILDADDWFNTEALIVFVNKLKEIDVDCVYTNFTEYNELKNKTKHIINQSLLYNTIIDLNSYILPDFWYAMHSLTFRLSLFKEISYEQTEGICYTDTEYIYYPFTQSKSMYAIDISLYQYYIGRDDQSVSFVSSIKNITDRFVITRRILEDRTYKTGNASSLYIRERIIDSLISGVLIIYILYSCRYDKYIDFKLGSVMNNIKTDNYKLYKKLLDSRCCKVVPFVKIWLFCRRLSFPILYPCHIYYLLYR